MSTAANPAQIAAQLPGVLAERSQAAFERLLAPDVRWGGREETEETCHNRGQAGDFYVALLAGGARLNVLHTSVEDDKIHARLKVSGPDDPDFGYEYAVQLTVRDGLVIDILQVYDDEPPMIELLYFAGCPHHAEFLPHLQELLDRNNIDSPVQLIEVTDDEEAHRLRFLGSPSLRINGHDVETDADSRSSYGMQCRIYRTLDGPAGTPDDDWILAAL